MSDCILMFGGVVDTKTLYLREIKTPAHRDSPEVKSRHLSPAMSMLTPALVIQMIDALNIYFAH